MPRPPPQGGEAALARHVHAVAPQNLQLDLSSLAISFDLEVLRQRFGPFSRVDTLVARLGGLEGLLVLAGVLLPCVLFRAPDQRVAILEQVHVEGLVNSLLPLSSRAVACCPSQAPLLLHQELVVFGRLSCDLLGRAWLVHKFSHFVHAQAVWVLVDLPQRRR